MANLSHALTLPPFVLQTTFTQQLHSLHALRKCAYQTAVTIQEAKMLA